jgi:hypothetical protein
MRERNRWLSGNELERVASIRINERGFSSKDVIELAIEQGISYRAAWQRLERNRPIANAAQVSARMKHLERSARLAAEAAAAVDARKAEIVARLKDEEE